MNDAMRDAALALLDAVTDERLRLPFPGDEERTRWFYTPTDHGGVPLSDLAPAHQQRVFALLGAALAAPVFDTVCTIIGLENLLDRAEGFQPSRRGRERGRDSGLYYVTVFGDPASGSWGFRFGGHHVSVHRTCVDGELVASTPSFLGADPADSRLVGGTMLRPLAAYEDLARDLVHAHPDAVATPDAPPDMASGNRPYLSEGDSTMNLMSLFRDVVNDDPPVVDPLIPLTRTPKGVATDDLQPLLDAFAEQVPEVRFDANAFRFLWAGGVERGEPHYYRLQSDDWLIEYDNVQRNVNHIHTVVRSWDGDFGRDVLSQHHAAHHR